MIKDYFTNLLFKIKSSFMNLKMYNDFVSKTNLETAMKQR